MLKVDLADSGSKADLHANLRATGNGALEQNAANLATARAYRQGTTAT